MGNSVPSIFIQKVECDRRVLELRAQSPVDQVALKRALWRQKTVAALCENWLMVARKGN